MKQLIGFILIIASMIFVYWETKHFGGNLVPQTIQELFCDILSILLFIVGVIFFNKRDKNF